MSSRTPSRAVSRTSSSTSTSQATLSSANKEKEALILAACRDNNLDALIDLATTNAGLISDDARRTAWPILLGCRHAHDEQTEKERPWQRLPPHKEEHQVALDVNRAFVHYPRNESDKKLEHRKQQLSDTILQTLRRHPSLCYFQGYHDIVQVFLLVLGPEDAPAPVARLSLLRIRDFMLSSMHAALSQLELLRPIFRAADPELYDHLPKNPLYSAIADTITMFAHNIQDYKDITRLFDFFLAQHAVMPIYLFAAVVLSRREELLEIDKEDEDILSAMLGKLPQPFDVEFHIARTVELYERLPPTSLRSLEWWKISSSSVLKTSATVADMQRLTLEDGERLLQQHEKGVQRQRRIDQAKQRLRYLQRRVWYYRRYGYFGLAFLVGAYAFWMGRTGRSFFGPLGGFLGRFLAG